MDILSMVLLSSNLKLKTIIKKNIHEFSNTIGI